MKDITDATREDIRHRAVALAQTIHTASQSLAIGREAWLEVFDAEAERLAKGES